MKKKKLIERLRSKRISLNDLCSDFKLTHPEMIEELDKLTSSGVFLEIIPSRKKGERTYHLNTLPDSGNLYHLSGSDDEEREINFAAASDLHFASKFHLPDTFRETMKRVTDEGIKRVYLAGDIVDGVKIYRGHQENILTSSMEEQTDIAAESFSKFPELEFWGIAGNHDYSFTQQVGAKPMSVLEAKCKNFKNLGDFRADVVEYGIKWRLLHGGSGRAYARSYPSQTYLRDLFSGLSREDISNVPHIIQIGHYHTFYQGKDHGIHIIQSGSFQDSDNEYCVRRGLTGPNGLFLIKMKVQSGQIHEFQTNYIEPKLKERGVAFSKTTRIYKK